VAAIWYRQHGTRAHRDLCAGCGKPLGGSKVLTLPHGEGVHDGEGQTCLLAFVLRWKREAGIGLTAIGIPTPPQIAEELGAVAPPKALMTMKAAPK
jgi:hypothetical protein